MYDKINSNGDSATVASARYKLVNNHHCSVGELASASTPPALHYLVNLPNTKYRLNRRNQPLILRAGRIREQEEQNQFINTSPRSLV